MSEPSIKVDETTETTTQPSGTNAEQSENIDYKAELERVKKQLDQAEFVAKKLTMENTKLKKVEESVDIEALVEQKVTEKVSSALKVNAESTVEKEIRGRASSPEEAELALSYYKRSTSTGDIGEDIENAFLLANKKRFAQELSETKRALISQSNVNSGTAPGQRTQPKKPVEITAEERKFAERYGLTPEELERAKS